MRDPWHPWRRLHRRHHLPPSEQPLDEIVARASTGKVSRRRLIATLTALGVSASASATFAGAAQWMHQRQHTSDAPGDRDKASHELQEQFREQQQFLQQEQQLRGQEQFRQHQQHLEAQTQGANATPTPNPNATSIPAALRDPALQARLDAIVHDYHPDAVVHDMLADGPIQGHEAIRAHKAEEFLRFSNLDFEVTRRYAVQDQVVAEWVARGRLHGTFKGLVGSGSGRAFEIPGVTLVSRDAQGKIVKESIYYNLVHVQRALGSSRA